MFLRFGLIILTGTTEWMKMLVWSLSAWQQWQKPVEKISQVSCCCWSARLVQKKSCCCFALGNYRPVSLSGYMSVYHIWKTGISTSFLGSPMQSDFYTWKMLSIHGADIANNNGTGYGVLRALPTQTTCIQVRCQLLILHCWMFQNYSLKLYFS